MYAAQDLTPYLQRAHLARSVQLAPFQLQSECHLCFAQNALPANTAPLRGQPTAPRVLQVSHRGRKEAALPQSARIAFQVAMPVWLPLLAATVRSALPVQLVHRHALLAVLGPLPSLVVNVRLALQDSIQSAVWNAPYVLQAALLAAVQAHALSPQLVLAVMAAAVAVRLFAKQACMFKTRTQITSLVCLVQRAAITSRLTAILDARNATKALTPRPRAPPAAPPVLLASQPTVHGARSNALIWRPARA